MGGICNKEQYSLNTFPSVLCTCSCREDIGLDLFTKTTNVYTLNLGSFV